MDMMTKMGHVMLEELIPIVRDAVKEAVETSSVYTQEVLQRTLKDHNRALLQMITAPSRTYAGEIASATMNMLAPVLEALSTGIARVATLIELATASQEYSALGSVTHGVTSTSISLNEIKHALRSVNCQVSKGYDMFQEMVKELRTAMASEIRMETKKEAQARTYFREMGLMRQLYIQRIPEAAESPQLKAMQDYIEAMGQVQLHFQEHFSRFGGHDYWQMRGYHQNSSNEEEKDPDLEEEEDEVEDTSRKNPPEQEGLIEAYCELAVQEEPAEEDHESMLEQVAEAQVALAIARSLDLDGMDGKPPALSAEELTKRRELADQQKSLEDELQRKEEEQWKKDAAQLGIIPFATDKQDISKKPSETPAPEPKEEEVPGTPQLKAVPIIVTPKEVKGSELGVLIYEEQVEVSNLTAPTTAMAVRSPEATQEEEVDTVISTVSGKGEESKKSKKEKSVVAVRSSRRLSEKK